MCLFVLKMPESDDLPIPVIFPTSTSTLLHASCNTLSSDSIAFITDCVCKRFKLILPSMLESRILIQIQSVDKDICSAVSRRSKYELLTMLSRLWCSWRIRESFPELSDTEIVSVRTQLLIHTTLASDMDNMFTVARDILAEASRTGTISSCSDFRDSLASLFDFSCLPNEASSTLLTDFLAKVLRCYITNIVVLNHFREDFNKSGMFLYLRLFFLRIITHSLKVLAGKLFIEDATGSTTVLKRVACSLFDDMVCHSIFCNIMFDPLSFLDFVEAVLPLSICTHSLHINTYVSKQVLFCVMNILERALFLHTGSNSARQEKFIQCSSFRDVFLFHAPTALDAERVPDQLSAETAVDLLLRFNVLHFVPVFINTVVHSPANSWPLFSEMTTDESHAVAAAIINFYNHTLPVVGEESYSYTFGLSAIESGAGMSYSFPKIFTTLSTYCEKAKGAAVSANQYTLFLIYNLIRQRFQIDTPGSNAFPSLFLDITRVLLYLASSRVFMQDSDKTPLDTLVSISNSNSLYTLFIAEHCTKCGKEWAAAVDKYAQILYSPLHVYNSLLLCDALSLERRRQEPYNTTGNSTILYIINASVPCTSLSLPSKCVPFDCEPFRKPISKIFQHDAYFVTQPTDSAEGSDILDSISQYPECSAFETLACAIVLLQFYPYTLRVISQSLLHTEKDPSMHSSNSTLPSSALEINIGLSLFNDRVLFPNLDIQLSAASYVDVCTRDTREFLILFSKSHTETSYLVDSVIDTDTVNAIIRNKVPECTIIAIEEEKAEAPDNGATACIEESMFSPVRNPLVDTVLLLTALLSDASTIGSSIGHTLAFTMNPTLSNLWILLNIFDIGLLDKTALETIHGLSFKLSSSKQITKEIQRDYRSVVLLLRCEGAYMLLHMLLIRLAIRIPSDVHVFEERIDPSVLLTCVLRFVTGLLNMNYQVTKLSSIIASFISYHYQSEAECLNALLPDASTISTSGTSEPSRRYSTAYATTHHLLHAHVKAEFKALKVMILLALTGDIKPWGAAESATMHGTIFECLNATCNAPLATYISWVLDGDSLQPPEYLIPGGRLAAFERLQHFRLPYSNNKNDFIVLRFLQAYRACMILLPRLSVHQGSTLDATLQAYERYMENLNMLIQYFHRLFVNINKELTPVNGGVASRAHAKPVGSQSSNSAEEILTKHDVFYYRMRYYLISILLESVYSLLLRLRNPCASTTQTILIAGALHGNFDQKLLKNILYSSICALNFVLYDLGTHHPGIRISNFEADLLADFTSFTQGRRGKSSLGSSKTFLQQNALKCAERFWIEPRSSPWNTLIAQLKDTELASLLQKFHLIATKAFFYASYLSINEPIGVQDADFGVIPVFLSMIGLNMYTLCLVWFILEKYSLRRKVPLSLSRIMMATIDPTKRTRQQGRLLENYMADCRTYDKFESAENNTVNLASIEEVRKTAMQAMNIVTAAESLETNPATPYLMILYSICKASVPGRVSATSLKEQIINTLNYILRD